jgi:hypothetical protein
MKQDDENEEEEAATVCQDFSDLFSRSLSLSLLSIGSRNHLLSTNGKREREGGENELITEQVK